MQLHHSDIHPSIHPGIQPGVRPPLASPMGRPRGAWWAMVALALGAVAFGVMAYAHEEHAGAIVTGMRNPGYGGASWGLYIVFVVFFIGVSFAGITVAALARLFRIEVLAPVTRMAELLTLLALIAGASSVVADLGRPLHGLLKLPRYVNPSSPFFGTFTLVVSGYLFSSLVYFFLSGRHDAARAAGSASGPLSFLHRLWASGYKDSVAQQRRHWRVSYWLSLAILPMLVTAHSTLGFVFGIQAGRPGWFGALQAPAFVVLAGVSGTGMLILLTLGFRWLFRLHDRIGDATIRWLANFLWILTLVYLYLMIVEELTATYAAPEADRHIAHQIVGGRFAALFWTTVASLLAAFAIPFVQYLRRRTSVGWIAVAALAANVGAVCKRFLIVVPSQTHGAFVHLEESEYNPSWVEIGVVVGLLGLVMLGLLVFGRIFPLIASSHGPPEAPTEGTGRDGLVRRLIAGVMVLCAISLIVLGLTDSFRLWNPGEIDPSIPYSPVVFASGVMLLFASAVAYELLPDRKPKPSWRELQATRRLATTGPLGGAGLDWGLPREPKRLVTMKGEFRQVATLAAAAESAVRNDDRSRALEVLAELQRLATSSSGKRADA